MGVYCGACEHAQECGEHPDRFTDCQDNADARAAGTQAREEHDNMSDNTAILNPCAACRNKAEAQYTDQWRVTGDPAPHFCALAKVAATCDPDARVLTVYVFDHSAGFDWYYAIADAEKEKVEYDNLGWLADYDGLYAVPLAIKSTPRTADAQDEITYALDGEDFSNLHGAVTLWRFPDAQAPRPFEDCDRPCSIECDRMTCDRDGGE